MGTIKNLFARNSFVCAKLVIGYIVCQKQIIFLIYFFLFLSCICETLTLLTWADSSDNTKTNRNLQTEYIFLVVKNKKKY